MLSMGSGTTRGSLTWSRLPGIRPQVVSSRKSRSQEISRPRTWLREQKPRYRQLSQRIVGFGNYEPPEDSKLPDGSVNVAKDTCTAKWQYGHSSCGDSLIAGMVVVRFMVRIVFSLDIASARPSGRHGFWSLCVTSHLVWSVS